MATLPLITAVLRTGADGILAPSVQPLSVPRGESVTQPFQVVDEAGEPAPLTGGAVVASVGPQNGPATISRQATLTDEETGLGNFELADVETDIGPPPLYWDLEFIDADGNTSKIVLQSHFTPAGGVYTPGQEVQVLPSQEPLAEGPAGPPGDPGLAGDIQPVGVVADAGSSGKYADASHVHVDRAIANVAGSYTAANITVDAYGRITAAANGSASSATSVGDTLSGGNSEGGSWLWEDSASGGFNDFFAYDPNLADGNQVYAMGVNTYTNTTDARDNTVWSAGWNYGAGGVFDTTKGALGESREQYYEVGGGFPPQMEHYMAFRPPDATGQPSLRYFSFNGRLGSPYSTQLFLTAAQVTVGTILNPNLMILDEGGPGDNGSFQVQSLNGHSTLKINDAVCEFIVSNGSTTRTIEFGYPISTIGTELRQIGLMRFFGDIQNNKSGNESTTVGAVGGAAALPATPKGYLTIILSDDSTVKIPYYNP